MNATTSVMYQMLRAKLPPPLNVNLMLFVSECPQCGSVLISTHGDCAVSWSFGVKYRAFVVDSVGLGITCLISLYYAYKAS